MTLTDNDRRRYARQLMLEGFGEAAQSRLAGASVLVIGAGGLGSVTLSYLAAAGIGRLGIIDFDHVELSNLHRQIIHEQADVGRLKIESAADRVSELNQDVAVEVYAQRLSERNAAGLVSRYDLVADGCDRFDARLAANAACYAAGVTLVSAAALGWRGHLLSVVPSERSPCYRCLVPEAPDEPDRCSEVGILGPLCGIIGSMQAMEILRQLTGTGEPLTGRWLRYDARTHRQSIATIERDPHCPVCS